jgi:hypothetical protein
VVVVYRARHIPFQYFVQDEKGNFRCDTGISSTVGENLPYRKLCTTHFFLALVSTHSEHDHSDSLRGKELRFSGFSEERILKGRSQDGRKKISPTEEGFPLGSASSVIWDRGEGID